MNEIKDINTLEKPDFIKDWVMYCDNIYWVPNDDIRSIDLPYLYDKMDEWVDFNFPHNRISHMHHVIELFSSNLKLDVIYFMGEKLVRYN